MNFAKLQGAGNDFVLVETDDVKRDWSRVSKSICDRHFGVGADGQLTSGCVSSIPMAPRPRYAVTASDAW